MAEADLSSSKLTTGEATILLKSVLPLARAIVSDPFTIISGNSKEDLQRLMAVMEQLQQHSELDEAEFAKVSSAAGLSADEWYSLTAWYMWYKVKAPFDKIEQRRQTAT